MQITGNSLGERQKELNTKVNEAAFNKVDFDEIKRQNETNDLDKLFKIDLASKYKNIDYIIEVLKSGDSLYISRALKCIWIYDNEYTDFINPDYLNQNVIPFMSMKMKKKMLVSISMHIRDETRAFSFYNYCKSEVPHIADKFLIFTSESFKENLIDNEIKSLDTLQDNEYSLKQFFGNSFDLVDAYLSKLEGQRIDCLYALRHLYFVSDVKYLKLLEKYASDDKNCKFSKRLGLRITKDIMNKHKLRFIGNPVLYANILNSSIFVKYTRVGEAKEYTVRLLPDESSTFWDMNFCKAYDFIIDILPFEDRYEFIKRVFIEKYEEEFEMSVQLNTLKYYKFMSVDEREAWALRHIENKKEILGVGEDFNWYKFVKFDKAFVDIKQYISCTERSQYVTPDSEKRARMILVLVESTRNQRDLEVLLNYYYENHLNEHVYLKRGFLEKVVADKDVYNFDKDCWKAFEKIICSLNVYNLPIHDINEDEEYRYVGLLYHMINRRKLPKDLRMFIKTEVCFYGVKRSNSFGKLNKEQKEKVYEYMLQLYVSKISEFENQTYDENVKDNVRSDIYYVVELLKQFEKKEEECPEMVKKYMELDPDFFLKKPRLTQDDLLRHLKEDIDIIISKFHTIEYNTVERSVRTFKLTKFLKKLKIYFPDDLAQEFLKFYIELLSHGRYVYRPKRITSAVVFGIFQLADDNFKCEFLTERVPSPSDAELEWYTTRYTLEYIQRAICRFACFSRPPVPLSNFIPYIVPVYLKQCLPMLNSYTSNLPIPLRTEFVESLIYSPEFIQIHGLRLAFRLFSSEKIKALAQEAWEKTRNVPMRMVIFKYVHKHLIASHDEIQSELFEVLKSFILDLTEDDHEDVFTLILNPEKIPKKFRGKYLEAVWEKLVAFSSNNYCNRKRMVTTINNIERNCYLIEKSAVDNFIYEHVYTMLTEKQILGDCQYIYDNGFLHTAKWNLAATYFTKLNIDEDNLKWILNTLKFIIRKFLEIWKENVSVVRKSCFQFIEMLITKNFECEKEISAKNSPIFESLLQDLKNSLPEPEIYMIVWNLRLTIIAIKAVGENSLEEIAAKYGREVGNLVREYVESKTYDMSFISKIVGAINSGVLNIVTVTKNDSQMNDLRALVAIELAEFGWLETDIIATEMLCACSSYTDSSKYNNLLKRITMIKNNEVKCLLYQKFVDSGFKLDVLINVS